MKILDFLSKITKRVDKDKVLEDLRISIKDLDTNIIPTYQSASEYMLSFKPKSREAEEASHYMLMILKGVKAKDKSNNLVREINYRLLNVRANAEFIEKETKRILAETTLTTVLEANKAVLIRAIGAIGFLTKFSLDFLNVIYAYEASDQGQESHVKLPMIRYVEKHRDEFAHLLVSYGVDTSVFEKNYKIMPSTLIGTDTTGVGAAASGLIEQDPIELALTSNFTYSPFLALADITAEWAINRYKAAEYKKSVLELRLLNYKQMREEGGDTPVWLDREISHTQQRIDKLDRYLIGVEEDLGMSRD